MQEVDPQVVNGCIILFTFVQHFQMKSKIIYTSMYSTMEFNSSNDSMTTFQNIFIHKYSKVHNNNIMYIKYTVAIRHLHSTQAYYVHFHVLLATKFLVQK